MSDRISIQFEKGEPTEFIKSGKTAKRTISFSTSTNPKFVRHWLPILRALLRSSARSSLESQLTDRHIHQPTIRTLWMEISPGFSRSNAMQPDFQGVEHAEGPRGVGDSIAHTKPSRNGVARREKYYPWPGISQGQQGPQMDGPSRTFDDRMKSPTLPRLAF
ncbi:hypothetical protein BGW80DRAFT_615434 [Lactifluus volemus]|nr:hypothetical protein BGW80DRAFT_615434 [Lactifluus volemus]